MSKPYYKKSHRAWYVNINGKPVRLGTDEKSAHETFNNLCTKDYPISEIITKFLNYHLKNSKEGTYDFYKRLKAFKSGTLKVSELRPFHVTDWVGDAKGNHRRNLMRRIKTCLSWAVNEGIIDSSPLSKMKLPPEVTRGDENFLTDTQWDTILLSVTDSNLADILILLHETGCRPQEARMMQSRHFDQEGKCVVLPKDESKGGENSRVIHLNDIALGIVEKRLSKGQLFSFSAKKLDACCAKISKRVGFRFIPYMLRHTFASNAIIKEVDLLTIATLLGHKNLKMLTKIYQHIRKRADFIKQGLEKISI